jgi:hypothetical protein
MIAEKVYEATARINVKQKLSNAVAQTPRRRIFDILTGYVKL